MITPAQQQQLAQQQAQPPTWTSNGPNISVFSSGTPTPNMGNMNLTPTLMNSSTPIAAPSTTPPITGGGNPYPNTNQLGGGGSTNSSTSSNSNGPAIPAPIRRPSITYPSQRAFIPIPLTGQTRMPTAPYSPVGATPMSPNSMMQTMGRGMPGSAVGMYPPNAAIPPGNNMYRPPNSYGMPPEESDWMLLQQQQHQQNLFRQQQLMQQQQQQQQPMMQQSNPYSMPTTPQPVVGGGLSPMYQSNPNPPMVSGMGMSMDSKQMDSSMNGQSGTGDINTPPSLPLTASMLHQQQQQSQPTPTSQPQTMAQQQYYYQAQQQLQYMQQQQQQQVQQAAHNLQQHQQYMEQVVAGRQQPSPLTQLRVSPTTQAAKLLSQPNTPGAITSPSQTVRTSMHSFAQLAAVAAGASDDTLMDDAGSPSEHINSSSGTTKRARKSDSVKKEKKAPPLPAPSASGSDEDDDYDDDDDDHDGRPKNQGRTCRNKKQACVVCHHAKTSCDGLRPCSRCIRLGRVDQCEERPRKEHYKKRQKREREEMAKQQQQQQMGESSENSSKAGRPPKPPREKSIPRPHKTPKTEKEHANELVPPTTPGNDLPIPLLPPLITPGHPLAITSLPNTPQIMNSTLQQRQQPLSQQPQQQLQQSQQQQQQLNAANSSLYRNELNGPVSSSTNDLHLLSGTNSNVNRVFVGVDTNNTLLPPNPIEGRAVSGSNLLFISQTPGGMTRRLSVPYGSPFLFSDGPSSILGTTSQVKDMYSPFSPGTKALGYTDFLSSASGYRFDDAIFQQLLNQENVSMTMTMNEARRLNERRNSELLLFQGRLGDRRNSAGQLLLESFPGLQGISRVQSPIHSPSLTPTQTNRTVNFAPLLLAETLPESLEAAAAASVAANSDSTVPATSAPSTSASASASAPPPTVPDDPNLPIDICTDKLRLKQRRATYGPSHSILLETHLLTASTPLMFATAPNGGVITTIADADKMSEAIMQYFKTHQIVQKFKTLMSTGQLQPRRIQSFFVHVSEVLNENQFKELTKEFSFPIFASTSASWKLPTDWNTSSLLVGDEQAKKKIKTESGGASNGETVKTESTGPIILPYHFTWHHSPTLAVNDDTANSNSVLATIQYRCLAGKIPTPKLPVDLPRFHAYKQKLKDRLKRKMKLKERKRVTAERKAGAQMNGTEQKATDAMDEEPPLDPHATSSDSSDSSSSESYSSDESDLDELCRGAPQQFTAFSPFGYIPPKVSPLVESNVTTTPTNHDQIKKLHEPTCPHYVPTNPLATSIPNAATPASVSGRTNPKKRSHESNATDAAANGEDQTTCTCPKVIEREMIVQCNREWERLFGYTQSDLRNLVITEGFRKTMSRLSLFDARNNAFIHSTEAILTGITEYRMYCVVVNKWGSHIPCLLTFQLVLSSDGDLEGLTNQWMVLPAGDTSQTNSQPTTTTNPTTQPTATSTSTNPNPTAPPATSNTNQ